MEPELKEISAAPIPKTARITFDDETFQKLVLGETLSLDLREGTNKVIVSLDPRSKYRKTYEEMLREMLRSHGRLIRA